ncbi:hypothetical protein KUTeg_014240 [Tegillarca granosa]|uniref:Uncharacterized protein n=1 Tax=Tegillarca granosa TaxID=220873 RepID=A0ABQ9EW12_TEGGR|nr:hypothetical protein KUTeg_014240 [Tegillarca granosa]
MELILNLSYSSLFVDDNEGGIAFVSEPPPQWEGRLLRVDREKNYRVYAKLTYDETNLRYRRIEELQEGSEEEQLDIIHLFKEVSTKWFRFVYQGKEYRIDLKTQKCNTTLSVRPWRPYGVPMNANFTGSALVGGSGLPGESLVVNNFFGRLSPNMSFAGVVTYTGCIPIRLDYIDTFSGTLNIEHNTYVF